MLIAANICGWILGNKRLSAAFGLILLAVLLFGVIFAMRACSRPPKLDEQQIREAQVAIEQRNETKLKEILAESDTAVDRVDSNILLAEEATRNAVKNYDGWTAEQLEAEIERRAKE